MEAFPVLLTLCVGNSPVTGEFPSQRQVTKSFDVFFDLRLNVRLNKQSRRRWFETPSRLLWSHCSESAHSKHIHPAKRQIESNIRHVRNSWKGFCYWMCFPVDILERIYCKKLFESIVLNINVALYFAYVSMDPYGHYRTANQQRNKHIIITTTRRFDVVSTCLLRCWFAGQVL